MTGSGFASISAGSAFRSGAPDLAFSRAGAADAGVAAEGAGADGAGRAGSGGSSSARGGSAAGGAFAGSGIPIADGMHDYFKMLNARDGGI
ncbi:hypothetical protein C2U72_02210, partial [Prosthecomicrobium hirschii]